MRIALKVGATYYPLAGEGGVSEQVHSSAADFLIDPESIIDPIEPVRAAASSFKDRGNLLTTVTFSTTRLFASPAEAELYCLDYDGAMPRTGILVIEDTGPGGASAIQHMASALVDPPDRRCDGCTVLLSYRATGGGITEIAGGDAVIIQVTGTLSRPDHPTVEFPLLYQDGEFEGRPRYEALGDPSKSLYWDSAWYLDDGGGADGWRSLDDVATPNLCTTWAPTGDATGVPVVALY